MLWEAGECYGPGIASGLEYPPSHPTDHAKEAGPRHFHIRSGDGDSELDSDGEGDGDTEGEGLDDGEGEGSSDSESENEAAGGEAGKWACRGIGMAPGKPSPPPAAHASIMVVSLVRLREGLCSFFLSIEADMACQRGHGRL